VGIDNIRSQKAMLKIGGVLTDRRVMRTLHGRTAESVIFVITKAGFARRVDQGDSPIEFS